MPTSTQKLYKKTLFVFRRDLRLEDNTGLIAALQHAEMVIPCFIFDPRQVGDDNQYRSNNAIQFMLESLHDLEQQCAKLPATLHYFYGTADEVVAQLTQKLQLDAVFCNRDYTPFSIARDEAIATACKKQGTNFHQYDDALLINPTNVLTKKGTPFAKFTTFYTAAAAHPVPLPKKLPAGTWYTDAIAQSLTLLSMRQKLLKTPNEQLHVRGGGQQGHIHLDALSAQKQYTRTYDIPALQTSNLSAYLKFGCLSIRTVYHTITKKLTATHPLIRQLYWRDFFSYLTFHYPHVFGHAFQKKYDDLPWSYNNDHLQAWCTGSTGFPIIDAGMRQLNATGYMHNRVRMIVASFLTKDLHLNWLEGERYFAQKLVDYDPALNNGNWQWCSSTGCDAQPYFRIFNPWLQQKKFDPDCTYIKRWIPELKDLDPKAIHTWYGSKAPSLPGYPKPIVDHAKEAGVTKKVFRSLSRKP